MTAAAIGLLTLRTYACPDWAVHSNREGNVCEISQRFGTMVDSAHGARRRRRLPVEA